MFIQYDFVKEEETFYMNLGDFKSHPKTRKYS